MINYEDFKDEKGNTNWKAYKQARIEAGEICRTCHTYILFPKGHSSTCSQCDDLYRDNQLDHSSLIRCPHCREFWDPMESDDYSILSDGEHQVECIYCNKRFPVVTFVDYTFESPALIEEENNEDE